MGGKFWLEKEKNMVGNKEWVETFYLKKENMIEIKGMGWKFGLEKEKNGRNKRNVYTKWLQIQSSLAIVYFKIVDSP